MEGSGSSAARLSFVRQGAALALPFASAGTADLILDSSVLLVSWVSRPKTNQTMTRWSRAFDHIPMDSYRTSLRWR